MNSWLCSVLSNPSQQTRRLLQNISWPNIDSLFFLKNTGANCVARGVCAKDSMTFAPANQQLWAVFIYGARTLSRLWLSACNGSVIIARAYETSREEEDWWHNGVSIETPLYAAPHNICLNLPTIPTSCNFTRPSSAGKGTGPSSAGKEIFIRAWLIAKGYHSLVLWGKRAADMKYLTSI